MIWIFQQVSILQHHSLALQLATADITLQFQL